MILALLAAVLVQTSPRPTDCRIIYDPVTQTCRVYCPPKPLVG